ncbi:MAG: LysM peptidoglycan-binding domain-containing protein, partial [bacterium]
MIYPGILSYLMIFCLSGAPVRAQEFQKVTVRPGDTLWSIANTYLKDPTNWNEILKYNRLPSSDPSVALPGLVLKVPVYMIK